MSKSVVIEAMYRLRCWKVTERFNSPYCTRGEIGGMRRGGYAQRSVRPWS